ncbi:hypothetical protein EDD85DRAFT_795999 [Armillaria nabsnona]|nr:hypothetical protein EDD85DRAFT_795999 [Armillaria nabsnona]
MSTDELKDSTSGNRTQGFTHTHWSNYLDWDVQRRGRVKDIMHISSRCLLLGRTISRPEEDKRVMTSRVYGKKNEGQNDAPTAECTHISEVLDHDAVGTQDGRTVGRRLQHRRWRKQMAGTSSTIYHIQGMVVNAQNSVAVAAAIGRLPSRHIPFVPPDPLIIPSLRPVALPQPYPSAALSSSSFSLGFDGTLYVIPWHSSCMRLARCGSNSARSSTTGVAPQCAGWGGNSWYPRPLGLPEDLVHDTDVRSPRIAEKIAINHDYTPCRYQWTTVRATITNLRVSLIVFISIDYDVDLTLFEPRPGRRGAWGFDKVHAKVVKISSKEIQCQDEDKDYAGAKIPSGELKCLGGLMLYENTVQVYADFNFTTITPPSSHSAACCCDGKHSATFWASSIRTYNVRNLLSPVPKKRGRGKNENSELSAAP